MMRVAVFAFLSVALVSTKAQAPDRIHHVEYRVTGSGKVSINCINATGGTEQRKAKLPWSLTFDANNGTFLYLSAQKSGWRGSTHANADCRVVFQPGEKAAKHVPHERSPFAGRACRTAVFRVVRETFLGGKKW